MRLFLLPISTRRTLIYCERVPHTPSVPGAKPPISERIIDKASSTWSSWEKAEKGWQKKVTVYGNSLFRRIPFEEWGLKTIPPATRKRLQDVDDGKVELQCLYPGAFMDAGKVPEVLRRLATERQALHKRKLWQSVLWMPVTAPFTLVPVIPNLPFFYLCFRAYSHYRALFGGRLLERLMEKNMVKMESSKTLDAMYTAGLLHRSREDSRKAPAPTEEEMEQVKQSVAKMSRDGAEEVGLLQGWNGKLLAEAFHLPEMEVEIERACEQVADAVSKDSQRREDAYRSEVMKRSNKESVEDKKGR